MKQLRSTTEIVEKSYSTNAIASWSDNYNGWNFGEIVIVGILEKNIVPSSELGRVTCMAKAGGAELRGPQRDEQHVCCVIHSLW